MITSSLSEGHGLDAVHHLVEALAAAPSLEAIYREAIEGLLSALHVDRASILLFDSDDVMRFKAWHGLSDAYRTAVEGHSPWAADARDVKSFAVEDVATEPSLAALRDTILGEGIRALAFVPLERERLLGKFMLYGNQPRRFQERELRLAETIAALVSFAIERRRNEESLLLYREIFDKSSDGIAVVDARGRYLEQNAAHRALLGYEDGDLARRTPALHLGEDAFRSIVEELVETGACRREVIALRKDGRATEIELSAFAIRDHGGSPARFVGLKRDVSERKAAERRLAQQTAALARSNAELQRFAYASSHDLKEPLRTIRNFVQLLQQRHAGRLDGDSEEFLGFIVDGVHRMEDLIEALMAYARVDWDPPEAARVELSDVVAQARANLKAALDDSGAVLEVGELPAVFGEPRQLVQLLQNLLSNAVKFRRGPSPRVVVSAQRVEGAWEISVADDGIGIAADQRDRVFEVFHRLHTRAAYPGAGLGLAICKKIVERHGGRIAVSSEEGRGTTFTFSLPAA
jgi:PAS domain S-box-containing protein